VFCDALEEVNIKRLGEITLFVRRHGKNMTQGKNINELGRLRVFRKSLDRMRAQKGVLQTVQSALRFEETSSEKGC
jgi:hypothetical protein